MKSNRETVHGLRHLLREKFGSRQSFSQPPNAPSSSPFPSPSSDFSGATISYKLNPGKIHEIVADSPSSGIGLVMERILEASLSPKNNHFVLIDGRDSFDPQSCPDSLLTRLLWVRCRHSDEAIKSADWLVRDGNIPLVILDLQFNPPAELRRIPISSWHRLRALVEESEAMLLVLTPEQTLPRAHVRWRLGKSFSLSMMDRKREDVRDDVFLD